MPEAKPTPPPTPPAPKGRNPVELYLVRGFIAVMLILVGIEANSWWQHKRAVDVLSAKMKAVDNEPNSPAVTESDIKAFFGSKQPDRSQPGPGENGPAGAGRHDVYSWFTMSPVNKREIYIYYGKGGADKSENLEVLLVQGDNKPPPPEPKPAVAADTPNVTPPGGGTGMSMGPPGGPGRPGAPGGHSGPGGRPSGASTGADSTDKPDGDASDAKETKDADSTGQKPDDTDAEKDQK